MDKIISLTNDKINVNSRLRYSKNQFSIEAKTPFFLVRLFRWIRGDYSKTRILRAADHIASNMLRNQRGFTHGQWQTMDANYKIIRQLCDQPKNGQFYANRENKIHAAALAALRQQRPPVQPVNPNDGWEPYDPSKLVDVLPPEPKVPAPAPAARPASPVLAIDPDLKVRWAEALDEDVWETAPLNSFVDLKVAEKLATPETLLQWFWSSTRKEDEETQAPMVKEKIGGNTAQHVADLLKLLGIETPTACMSKAIEPKKRSFEDYFTSKADFLRKKLIAEGYLKPANG